MTQLGRRLKAAPLLEGSTSGIVLKRGQASMQKAGGLGMESVARVFAYLELWL